MSNQDRHPRIRYRILQILSKNYPNPLDLIVLRRTLANFGMPVSMTDFESYMAYLIEKGYAKDRWIRVQDGRVSEQSPIGHDNDDSFIRMIQCTADGLDAIDGRILAPGLARE